VTRFVRAAPASRDFRFFADHSFDSKMLLPAKCGLGKVRRMKCCLERRAWRRIVILILGVALIGLHAVSGQTASNRIVVMISVDGLAGYYLDDPKAEMPTIRALAASGARAASMKATTPTVTWPNHTTLVTGVAPAKHGVVGNNYYDRATGKRVVLIADPVYDKGQIVKVQTIYDAAKAAGLKTAAVRWPATRNASTLDWTTPDCGKQELIQEYTTPALLRECQAAGLDLEKRQPGADALDGLYTGIFNHILRAHRPNLALLHLINVDHTEHEYGPQSAEAYAAVKMADQRVGEVWEELKRDFPGTATLVVVSDHGFSPIKRVVLPNVILRQAGINPPPTAKAQPAVYVVPQGGSAFLYICDEANRKVWLKRVRKAFTGAEGVAKIVGVSEFPRYGVADPKKDPHAPDLILFARLGYSFGDTAAGDLPFKDKPERSGSHGHDPNLPELHATFVAWGAGIKPGTRLGEISNSDVAPTIARLLGLRYPADGKPLTQILKR